MDARVCVVTFAFRSMGQIHLYRPCIGRVTGWQLLNISIRARDFLALSEPW